MREHSVDFARILEKEKLLNAVRKSLCEDTE